MKSGTRVHEADLRGLLALLDDAKVRRAIVVCDERAPRKVGAIEIMPWKHFTSALWAGDLIG